MFKYYNALLNRSGDALAGYFVRLFDSSGNQVTIYADENETAISTESGVANAAKSDVDGMVRFFVPSGDYDIRLYDPNDNFISTERAVPMVKGVSELTLAGDDGATKVGTSDSVTVQDALDARVKATDLASTDSDKGAALVALAQGGSVGDAIKYVTPEMFGAVGDGEADDSDAVQDAIDYLESIGGGKLLCAKSYLVGDLTIDAQHIVVEGLSRCAKFIVKNGTTGFTVSKDWVHFRHIELRSEGSEGDGEGTNGILYTKGTGSIGHVYNYDINVENFSGVGVEFRNGLDITMVSCFHRHCKTGLKFGRNGTGGADFTTTTQIINCYVIGCDNYGIESTYAYRSSWNVIAEYCGVGIYNNIGDLTLERCYFENNTTAGAQLIDTVGQDIDNYSHPSAGVNTVTRTRSAIGNTSWYTAGQIDGDRWSKRLGLQSAWGRDTKYLAGVGTTATVGLKFGQAVIPFIPGADLLDQKAWAGETTSEYAGWDIARGAHKIATALTGVRGMRQSVSLDSTKTYVAYFLAENVAGNAISNFQVDGNAVTNGVPFTVSSTGSKVVRCYASQSDVSENYVTFHLFEVAEDSTQIVKGVTRLLQQPVNRSRPASAAPSSGKWAVGEMVQNTAPSAGSPYGWVCTTGGTPGTWSPFGLVGLAKVADAYTATNVTTDRSFDADTVTIAELADVVGTLLADLKTAGLLP